MKPHLALHLACVLSAALCHPHMPPFMTPFFFLCDYHTKPGQSPDSDTGDVTLSVSLAGNPQAYVPGETYEVTIESSRSFDAFLLTGLYSEVAGLPSASLSLIAAGAARSALQPATASMCSVIHSYMSHQPKQRLVFTWPAPHEGTGCLSFLATATLGDQILFKDTTVLHICEKGSSEAQHRPNLAVIHQEGVILRDDFDSTENFDKSRWSSHEGFNVSKQCGTIGYGFAAVACHNGSERKLVTIPLTLTSAKVMQFTLSSGTCKSLGKDEEIILSYSDNNCTEWTTIQRIQLSPNKGTYTQVVQLPHSAKKQSVCLKWEQELSRNFTNFDGCWALDNVLVVNITALPIKLEENFDPVDPANWLFFPGAIIKHKCQSNNNAMIFQNGHGDHNYVTTVDLDLHLQHPQDLILTETFQGVTLKGWTQAGGRQGQDCGILHEGPAIVFSAKAKKRLLCTPYLDLSTAGNLKFYYTAGHENCHSKSSGKLADVFVFADDEHGHTVSLAVLKTSNQTKAVRHVSVPVTPAARAPHSRVCWVQKTHGGRLYDAWAVDMVQLLPVLPTTTKHFVQFDVNLHCGAAGTNSSVVLEFSVDHGLLWYPLHEPCLPGDCPGELQTLQSVYKADHILGWERITVPVANTALTSQTRFRWRQLEATSVSSWAIDNVYIGACAAGCSSHGYCVTDACRCDSSYEDAVCASATGQLSSMLIEDMLTDESVRASFAVVKGASLGYVCGVVASGKALVFNADGRRELQTNDLNTTDVRYLQFSVRVGSQSETGDCPPPDHANEAVLLQVSCTGGTTWQLLQQLLPEKYSEPQMVSVHLPPAARQPVCRLRWWQPAHSGRQRDVWAVDDVSLTSHMYNTISVDFRTAEETQQALQVHLGKLSSFCGRPHTLSFTGPYQTGESRYLLTDAMHVGPSYVIQFELRMGCRQPYAPHIDNRLQLECSVDHGMTWALVHDGCWPPRMCSEHHAPSVFHATEFERWRRVAIALPPSTWSSSSRFQLRQVHWTERDSWAATNLYIGQQCPEMCTGHGTCVDGVCKCDTGFHGSTCVPQERLPASLKTDFSRMSKLHSDWSAILGGEVAGSNQGCGIMLSGESMYFSKDGPRQLVSRDLYTNDIDYLQFYIRVAGGNNLNCYGIERREENILVQFSNNGGITWQLMKELQETDYNSPRFVHIELPDAAQTACTRFRWWQPSHSGPNVDQWAVDEIIFAKYEDMKHFQDNFQTLPHEQPDSGDIWLTITEGMYAPYCQSADDTLAFVDQHNDKFAMTKDLRLQSGDIVQFRINVGCSRVFSYRHPVLFQYSHDAGMSWALVDQPCYLDDQCERQYSEGSVYYVGTYGEWRLVLMHVTDDILHSRVNFRWWQKGGAISSFALDDVYIGRPCPKMCSGHGICVNGHCECDTGYDGEHCLTSSVEPHGMIDRFDNMNRPSDLWERILGGQLGTGCGVLGGGNTLYFAGSGSREARTVPLNTTNIRMTQFMVQVGSAEGRAGCAKALSRNEGVVVDFSTDNGVTWHVLRVLDPEALGGRAQVVTLELPARAKAPTTVIRWWQPIVEPGNSRAEWAIDDVIIAVNDTSNARFQENFNPMKREVWYMAMNAIPKITCSSRDNALEFSKNGGAMRYAETWDYQVSPSTFLQFDIAMGCSGTFSTLYTVQLQYSVDMGHTWHFLADQCLPPQLDCNGYHLSSSFMSDAHANWTRVTRYLPAGAISRATRFRWLQETVTQRGNVWALDNIYLGDGCPWMCSGHGHCDNGDCICDKGYFGVYCVPAIPLPVALKDHFDSALSRIRWPELYGGEVSSICGILVSQMALTFYKNNLRMVVSQDLDVSMATFLQFTFQYGCQAAPSDWPREHTVLLQYSNNGGILWHLLKEIHFLSYAKSRFFSVQIPTPARTNSTRFRFWQPEHDGHMNSIWAIDNFFANGAAMNPDMLYETFGSEPNPDFWIFWPGGRIDKFCSFNTSPGTMLAGSSAMVFSRGPGEHSITTRDLSISEMTVIQFDINVGCTAESTHEFPVRLEYSKDQGKSWMPLVAECSSDSLPTCADRQLDSTVYFPGTTENWRRVVVPLAALHLCGSARFRWYQGAFSLQDLAPEWAIDNVYIGMQCQAHCGGHGSCINGMLCQCDEGYDTNTCMAHVSLPTHLKEDFEVTSSQLWDRAKWAVVSGGGRSKNCGQLLNAHSLHFTATGDRVVMTTEMDLSVAMIIAFFLRLGCASSAGAAAGAGKGRPPDAAAQPVLLQFSVNGGITWRTIEQFGFSKRSVRPKYIAIHVPQKARTPSTRIRWWQPSTDGTYREQWAIDQVYIGGNINGRMIVEDSTQLLQADVWVIHPSGTSEPVCGSPSNALHFRGKGPIRYAVTADITITEATYLQFYISMGCTKIDTCYGVELQYSLDFGQTWKVLQQKCLLSDVDCTDYYSRSVFTSDLHHSWTRVTILLPYYTRSSATRLRWIQPAGFEADHTWALMWLYVGDECEMACSGHGRCHSGTCLCDTGWVGAACAQPKNTLPTLLSDSFTDRPDKDLWLAVNGGEVSKQCGVLSSGPALYFAGACTRQLISADLDLREAIFIQFHFKFGCVSAPTHRDHGVLIHYSTDGGITWHQIIELLYDQYKNSSFKLIALPDASKVNGVRLRFWQMAHGGSTVAAADWAVDNVLVAGKAANPAEMKDDFHERIRRYMWFEDDNARLGAFCGSRFTISGAAAAREDVVLTTADMAVRRGYVLQFSLSVGCNATDARRVAPITLQFSTSYGMRWRHLVHECLSFYPECNGDMTSPSVYFASSRWRRITIKLKGATLSRATRFRWYQTSVPSDAATRQQWALDDVYIGPACEDLCNGHGQCDYPVCICDRGYSGKNCYQVQPIKTYLKDTFSEGYILEENWSLVQGGSVSPGCRMLVEGAGLHFKGKGQRQAITVDLDLRNARFIQYYAMIGGPSTKTECGTPTDRRDSVILQYSTDAGIVWRTLHVLDYNTYWRRPVHDYIPLPRTARTNSTRVRWWQSFSGDGRLGWTLDDVYIGGREINPSELYDAFLPPLSHSQPREQKWEFSPNGRVRAETCGRKNSAVYWTGDAAQLKATTTEQLIVQSGYMLQFKITVGCSSEMPRCSRHQAVHLQYNKQPLSSADWQLVFPECLLHADSAHAECHANPHSPGSVYSANSHATWTRVSLRLPSKVFSSTTRFRWIQQDSETDGPDWGLDDVYIGEACPEFCNGRGDCVRGKCICDPTYSGATCEPAKAQLISHMTDGFEEGVSPQRWQTVSGGGLGLGCGSLLPYAHGKTLYFNGCGVRQAVTAEMDLTKSSKVMFVLQIGSKHQTASCNIQQASGLNSSRVLLQYTANKGIDWHLLASHEPNEFGSPKRVGYDIPVAARTIGVQLRWWQPRHAGTGKDQWAMDYVEVVMTRQEQMMRTSSRYHKRYRPPGASWGSL